MIGMLSPGAFFENLGIRYIGPIDGHNVKDIEKALSNAKLHAIDNIFLPKTSVHDKASHLFFAAPVSLSKAETPWKTSGLFSAP